MAISFKKKADKKQTPRKMDADYKNFIVKAVGLISSQGSKRGEFLEPEYDLDEIKKAADSDSYIKMALMKYSYLIYKAGYILKADNDAAVDYIKTRFKVMGFATNKPIDILFQEISDDLVKYSNAFLVKSRVDSVGFNVKAKGVTGQKPIGGYFRMDPTYVKIKRDKHGTVQAYEQWNDEGDRKVFPASEVIHIYMDKDASNAYGTPRLLAALEDVKLLRRIEGNVVSLIYRFAIPIYQWMIGLPQQGMQATETEIRDAQREVENMSMDGIVFTNERTQIKAIGAEGNALDASNYLAYFERRVFTALGVSDSQMGRGGAKQDADSMEAQVHDTVKYIQRVIKIFTENMIIAELLLEGGFNPILDESDYVSYDFEEISLETKVKVENHEMLKFQSNVKTFEETRTSMGMDSNADEERLNANMITKKIALEQADNQAMHTMELADKNAENAKDLAKINAANKPKSNEGGKPGNNGSKSSKPNKDTETRNRPKNQHGVTSAKVKESLEVEESTKSARKHKKSYETLYKRYDMLRNDITEDNADIDVLIPLTRDGMTSEIKTLIQQVSYEGITKATDELSSSSQHRLIPNINVSTELFNQEADKTIKKILTDVKLRLKAVDVKDSVQVQAVFDALEYRIRFLIEYIMPKAYWYSYIKAGAELGAKTAYVEFNDSPDKESHPSEINTKNFDIADIPAYHSFCNCKVTFKKAGD